MRIQPRPLAACALLVVVAAGCPPRPAAPRRIAPTAIRTSRPPSDVPASNPRDVSSLLPPADPAAPPVNPAVNPPVDPPPSSGCACDATTACDYDCPCDPQCPCACDTDWACEACDCDPECQSAYGDCGADGVCNGRCPADSDCPTAWTGGDACGCDATGACDYDCPCDPQCPCDCDREWLCEAGCGCDPECQAAYGDCVADGTCNPRCTGDPDCAAPVPPGPPPAGPDAVAGLEAYRLRCVEQINAYRATLGLAPLARWREAEGCVDGQSADDGATGRAHGTFGRCGERAQNTCPGYSSFDMTVTLCLEQMWNEGPGEPFSEHGHFLNMSSTVYTQVACGFAVLPDGTVWALQDFR